MKQCEWKKQERGSGDRSLHSHVMGASRYCVNHQLYVLERPGAFYSHKEQLQVANRGGGEANVFGDLALPEKLPPVSCGNIVRGGSGNMAVEG